MFNVFNRCKHISENKYMLYSRKCTDESIKKLVSQMIEREKLKKIDITYLSSQNENNNLIIPFKEMNVEPSFCVFFLSISSLMYYFLNRKE
jgi:hypothetical protein